MSKSKKPKPQRYKPAKAPRETLQPLTPADPNVEKLVGCAIMRDGIFHPGFKSHTELRASLGDADPYTKKIGDQEGFHTSRGRFVGRNEAADIAFAAGQLNRPQERELLSSDIDKW